MPAQAHTLLDIYFQDRPTLAGKVATPTWQDIATKVIAPSGSAPGADGVPYEVFHHGTRFATCLLGQAVHAAALHSSALETVLGPSCDLLVWILKAIGADTPSGMRPLQLPSTWRRLFGAVTAGAVGPVVEPCLPPDQAAVAGGHCGPNIKKAYSHMTTPAQTRAPDRQWLAALCGPHHDLVWDDATTEDVVGLDSPAILFADQNKAFERVSYPWMAAEPRRWGFDPWVLRSFLALNVGRCHSCQGRPLPPSA